MFKFAKLDLDFKKSITITIIVPPESGSLTAPWCVENKIPSYATWPDGTDGLVVAVPCPMHACITVAMNTTRAGVVRAAELHAHTLSVIESRRTR